MSLKKYIAEAEARMHRPDVGDTFAIELEDGTLLETYIMAMEDNAILLDATDRIVSVLAEWNYIGEEAGDVLLEDESLDEAQQLDEFLPALGALAGRALAGSAGAGALGRMAAGAAGSALGSALTKDKDEELDEDDYQDEQSVAHQDSGEYDYEGDMAKDDLYTIIRAARKLTGMLDDDENMPEWVQSKINKAADYVDTAADYIESNKERAEDEQGMAEGEDDSVDLGPALRNLTGEFNKFMKHDDRMKTDPAYAKKWNKRYAKYAGNDDHSIYDDPDDEVTEGEMAEAKYQGREVPLGKPMRGDVKKFKVYVRDPKSGNVKKVNFGHGGTSAKRAGQKTMSIKKSDPARRRSFRARHHCENPGPRTKARYWSCRKW